MFNESDFDRWENSASEYFRVLLIIFFILIVSIGLIGNILVLISILTNHIKIRRSSTNLLLVNMSCADLLILFFNIFDIIQFAADRSWPSRWFLGLPLCKIVRFCQVLGCYVSVETLIVICIERYIAIVHPLRISASDRRKRLVWVFFVIWIIGLMTASPNLFLLTLHPHHFKANAYLCGLSNDFGHSHWILVYKYLESILFFFIPICLQFVLYIIICRNIFLVDRAVQAHCRNEQLQQYSTSDSIRGYSATKISSLGQTPLTDHNPTLIPMISSQNRLQTHVKTTISNATMKIGDRARKKAIIMLLLVAVLYFAAFSPAQINFIYSQINQSHHLYEHRPFFVLSILLVLSSTAFNPILFYIFSKFFRHKFNIILRSLCPVCRVRPRRRQNNIPMI